MTTLRQNEKENEAAVCLAALARAEDWSTEEGVRLETPTFAERFPYQMIDGEWVKSVSAAMLRVTSPATGEDVARIPAGDERDAARAVKAAARAFPAWAATPLQERIRLVETFMDLMAREEDDIVHWESAELGTPLAYTRQKHCRYQLSRIPAYIDSVRQLDFESRRRRAAVLIEPVGVVAAVTPWNFPLGQIFQKVVPALLMGNTVVLKPSSLAPLTAVIMADCMVRAGFPKGVFNLINGSGRVYEKVLTAHPDVALVSFTGSTEVGRRLSVLSAAHFKRVSLELGGKSPFIWLKGGADDERAARTLMKSAFLNAGQTCTALTRVLIPEDDAPRLKALFTRIHAEFKVGAPDDPASVLGPVISRTQYESIRARIEEGLAEGATLWAGKVPGAAGSHGWYIEPVILGDVKNSMKVAREEIFGPVLSVITYRSVEEAVKLANDSRYGLSSCIYGPETQANALARRIDAGNVFINDSPRDITAPFGGFKESGIGYESGREGLMTFARIKSVFDGRSAL